MNTLFLGIVIFLIVLAVFDLVVGVSNDAVNFLNSAIGAKVARYRTVVTVAAIGVFAGAALSNGMMVWKKLLLRRAMYSVQTNGRFIIFRYFTVCSWSSSGL